MSILWPFKKKSIAQRTIPKAGERWYRKYEDDPWPKEDKTGVKILDVKEGWVRYSFGSVFTDERHPMDTFLMLYKGD